MIATTTRRAMKPIFVVFLMLTSLATLFSLSSCETGGGGDGAIVEVSGNEGGSKALNPQEGYELQKAVNRCHRTGGTRVVKIKGELKCY